jgi:hypothetical protein
MDTKQTGFIRKLIKDSINKLNEDDNKEFVGYHGSNHPNLKKDNIKINNKGFAQHHKACDGTGPAAKFIKLNSEYEILKSDSNTVKYDFFDLYVFMSNTLNKK